MNFKLFPNKGCAVLASGSPNGYWKLRGLNSSVPVLIMSVSKEGNDVVGTTICFNKQRVAAIISKNFGGINLNCIALVGEVTQSNAFENYLVNFIKNARSSESGALLSLSSKGGTASKFLLTNYSINGPDLDFNIFKFSLGGLLID